MLLVVIRSGGTEPTVPTVPSSGPQIIEIAYGEQGIQTAELSLPPLDENTGPVPVVVLIHGGFWRSGFDSTLMDPLIPSLVDSGFAVWNLDYRSVGDGGGHPETFEDIATAIDMLAALPDDRSDRLALHRVATVGHSAGGHLAVWAAARTRLTESAPGSGPLVIPALAVSQAGVLDLRRCVEVGVGGSACSDIVGGELTDQRWSETSPMDMLPIDVPLVLVHGDSDRIVPLEQSASFAQAATVLGDVVTIEVVAGANHFSVIDPEHASWAVVLDALDVLRTPSD